MACCCSGCRRRSSSRSFSASFRPDLQISGPDTNTMTPHAATPLGRRRTRRRTRGRRPAMLPAARYRARHAHRVECRLSPGMDCATPEIRPPTPESDVLVCLAAVARALEAEFQPRAFLDDFSTACIRSYHTIVSVSGTSPTTGERSRCSRNMADQESCRRRTATRRTCSARRAFRSPTHCWPRCSTETSFASRTFRRSALRSFGSIPRRVAGCWSAVGDIRAARWSVAASSAI